MSSFRFSGHESFVFRHTWLTKGVTACADDSTIFRQPDALVTLGVGKNMVDSIKYWCLAAQLIEERPEERYSYHPTPIGEAVFIQDRGWDPYLEDEGTLWLIHWLLATNPSFATTIYFVFNELTGLEFSRTTLYEAISRLANKLQARVTPNTLRRDVNVLIHSYVGGRGGPTSSVEDTLDCPLANLKLLYEEPLRQTYAFARGPKDTLPDAVFLYALWTYVKRQGGRKSFTFDELAYFPCSPGRVFKLDETALAERLEHMEPLTQGAWQLTETTGYRQVIVRQDVNVLQILDSYYRQHTSEDAHARG